MVKYGEASDLLRTLLEALMEELPGATALRERLHAAPEPSHEERETARLVEEYLGAEIQPVAGSGFLSRIGPADEKAVVVRAELDALPIEEATGAPFASSNGLMHACGHDVHMAALAALFRAARRLETALPMPLVALFQPSEEAYPSGAELIFREGVLDGKTTAVVAAHVHPDVPWGEVSAAAGPVNASSDNLRIVVTGAGGHGAYPHRSRDPILALSHVVVALQSLISRRLDPMRPGVFSVGWTRAGTVENVIPDKAEAGATLRVLYPEDRLPLREAVREVAVGTAQAYGCDVEIKVIEGEPATVNDPGLVEAARLLLPEAQLRLAPEMRSCGSDDFGFYGGAAPILMAFVGLAGAPGGATVPLHHPRFLPPAEAVGLVARTLAGVFAAASTAHTDVNDLLADLGT